MTLRRIALPALLVAATVALAGCGSDSSGDGDTGSGPSSAAADGACQYDEDTQGTVEREVDPPPAEPAEDGPVDVTITTNFGDLKATLDGKNAPCAVNSFISLAEQGYYDKTDCHRVTRLKQGEQGFNVLQCGDPTGTGTGSPGYRFAEELTGQEDYKVGSLALANTGQPSSSGGQFFIDYDQTDLPPSYTQFGQLDAASIKVAQKAAAAATKGQANGYDGKPVAPVQILKVTVG